VIDGSWTSFWQPVVGLSRRATGSAGAREIDGLAALKVEAEVAKTDPPFGASDCCAARRYGHPFQFWQRTFIAAPG
jgi:hypothetical protein